MKVVKRLYVGALLLFLPFFVEAQGLVPRPITGLPGGQGATAGAWIRDFILMFLEVAGLIAVAFIIYGGFRYITSAGNEEAAESGKNTLTNAIIGLVIIILSYVIVAVLINALARGDVN